MCVLPPIVSNSGDTTCFIPLQRLIFGQTRSVVSRYAQFLSQRVVFPVQGDVQGVK
jgi:hypothetical protein